MGSKVNLSLYRWGSWGADSQHGQVTSPNVLTVVSFAFFKFLNLGSWSIIDFWLSDLIGLGLGFSQVGSTSKMGQLSSPPR